MNKKYLLLIFLFSTNILYAERERLEVRPFSETWAKIVFICVVDNLSYTAFQRAQKDFSGGLKKLAYEGESFPNAYWPLGMPGTAPAHASLVSGTIPTNHGIIDNKWLDKSGTRVSCDDDKSANTAILGKAESGPGKSGNAIMVDTIADQITIANPSNAMYCIAQKSRSAIMSAGKTGKAIWFDEERGRFTSSNAYFSKLPEWLEPINQELKNKIQNNKWQLLYEKTDPAYEQTKMTDYSAARIPSLIGTQVPAEQFVYSPASNQAVLDCAYAYIKKHIENKPNESTPCVVLVSLGSSDKIAHRLGPDSFEYLDTLYQLDQQLGTFFKKTEKLLETGGEITTIFTADHGCMPMVEDLKRIGYTHARRINTIKLLEMLNSSIEKEFNVKNAVAYIDPPDLYFDKKLSSALPRTTYNKIVRSVKGMLKKQPGIKRVWRASQLAYANLKKDNRSFWFKQQVFRERSGDLIFEPYPYARISKRDLGTGHKTPYEYDTHVPLITHKIVRWKDMTERRSVTKPTDKKVWLCQVAPTVAHMLEIAPPSAATFESL